MIFLWLVGFWFTMSLVKPDLDESKAWKMAWKITVCYVIWPMLLGTYLRSKLEKEGV